MENIITSNLNFVKRVITSKVEANKQHTRFILADNFIKVKSNNKPINMRYLILTDEKSLPLFNNSEFFYGLFQSVRKKNNSEALSDGDFGAVSSCLLGPTSHLTPQQSPDDKNRNKNFYTIGFDSEWVECSGRRYMLSYQLSQYIAELGGALIEFILFLDGRRLSLSRLLSIYTHVLQDEFKIPIGVYGDSYKRSVVCYLVPHYSIADVTGLFDSKEILRNTDTIRRTQTSVEKPLYINVYDKYYNFSQTWVVFLRDTMHLAPAQSSLEKLANAMGKIKLELPAGYDKNRMDILLKEQPDEFVLYACNDATLALEYVNSMYPDKRLPVTLGSEGADIFREKIMSLNGWNLEVFDYEFRGLIRVKGDDGRTKLHVRPEAAMVWEAASQAYYGGRNECYAFGIHHGPWFDYDLTGAYPTAMSMLRNIDYSKITTLTGDIINIDPLSYTFGYVEFEFPDNVMYPCLPVKDLEGRGLIYPRRGRTYASAPELYVALRMGARLKWVQPGIQVGAIDGKYDMREALTELLRERAEAKKLYGKGSVQEVRLKEIVNSIYGKCAQGLAGKRNYSTRQDAVRDMPPSNITQPLIASLTTSIVRAIVSSAMHQLHEAGFRIASVTTDGFLTDAPPEVLEELDLFGFRDAYKHVRNKIVGDPSMWEIKHKAKTLVMITTRGAFGIGAVDDNSPLPVAKAGYKPEQDFLERFKNKVSEELARRFLTRKGKIKMGFYKLPSPKDYIRRNADGVGVYQKKKIEWEYDLKRKPINLRMETVTIDGETYEHLSFDTVPWDTWEDFNDARAIKKAHPELYPLKDIEKGKALMAMIRDKQAVKDAGMLIQSNDVGGIYRTAVISYLRSILGGKEPMPSWMVGKSYKELTEAFNERLKSLNIVLTIDDFKNAKRRSNKRSLENSEALEIVKRLLI